MDDPQSNRNVDAGNHRCWEGRMRNRAILLVFTNNNDFERGGDFPNQYRTSLTSPVASKSFEKHIDKGFYK